MQLEWVTIDEFDFGDGFFERFAPNERFALNSFSKACDDSDDDDSDRDP